MKKKNNKRGFTLAELLIVVAIIAVLVAISIPIFTTQLEKSREAVDAANLRSAYAAGQVAALTEAKAGEAAVDAWYDPASGTLSTTKPAKGCGKGTETKGGTTFDLPTVCTYDQEDDVRALGIKVTYTSAGVSACTFASLT